MKSPSVSAAQTPEALISLSTPFCDLPFKEQRPSRGQNKGGGADGKGVRGCGHILPDGFESDSSCELL